MKLTVNPPPLPIEETYSVTFTRAEKYRIVQEISKLLWSIPSGDIKALNDLLNVFR